MQSPLPRRTCQFFLAAGPFVYNAYTYVLKIDEAVLFVCIVLHIAPLAHYTIMMRCHIYKGTTSSLCAKIRAKHVEPGRSVLKLQQHQRSHSLDTHTQTHTWRAQGWKTPGKSRWLYEQHSSEIPQLKVAEAAETSRVFFSQTSVALWRKVCRNVEGNSLSSNFTTTMVRIHVHIYTYKLD